MTEDQPALQRVHLIGVGGAGMSGIARILVARGTTVSGCDAKDSRTLAVLRARGVDVHIGHADDHLGAVDVVVYSNAIRPDNPELVAARERGLRVLPRAAALAALMADRRGVAVAGTHGKTTTTSMLTVALQHCGLDPSYAIGGDLNEAGSNAHHGSGDVFVAEADESDESFLLLAPFGAVVTNVELDHVDHYRDEADVHRAFAQFIERLRPDGFLVACADDPGSRRLVPVAADRGLTVVTYGAAEDADVRVTAAGSDGMGITADLVRNGRRLGELHLAVPGWHNAMNATGALTAGMALGESFSDLRDGLVAFTGARRRFELKGVAAGVRVVDDYAHNPTKLRAALTAARGVVGNGGRVVAAFQPHRYTRTHAFVAELGEALALADEVVVMDVYGAGEDPIPGVTGALVAAAVPLPAARVAYEPSWSAVPAELARRVRPGDLVLTLGAGDVTMLGPELLDVLADRSAQTRPDPRPA